MTGHSTFPVTGASTDAALAHDKSPRLKRIAFGRVLPFLLTTEGGDIDPETGLTQFLVKPRLAGFGRGRARQRPVVEIGDVEAARNRRRLGVVGAAEHAGRTGSSLLIFVVGLVPLIYLYFEGYRGAQQALAYERWTAAALSVGLLPFVIGIPVMMLVAFASMIALRLESRTSD